jgi:hypothetical protein
MSLPAQALYGKSLVLTVEDLDLSGFDAAFSVTRTLEPTPNTAEVRVYNLGQALRRELATKAKDGLYVTIAAGFGNRLCQIYRGDLRDAFSVREDGGWVTTISSGDGEKARRTARIRRAFPPGTKIDVALRALTESFGGVGLGNITDAIFGKKLTHGSSEFVSGTVLHGSSATQLTELLRSVGMEWSIQDGELQLLDKGAALVGEAIVLTPETGLVGSPEPGNKGTMKCTVLLMPGLQPGTKVLIDTSEVHGLFRIERIDYSGDTSQDDWVAHIEGKEVKA